MALRLNGATSGFVELNAPDAAGSNTLTLPDGNGTSGQYLQTNGSGGLSWQTGLEQGSVITAGTAVDSTSGTAIDFTGIPSWVKRITVMFNGVSTSGTSNYLIQLGDSGGIETTGYLATSSGVDTAVATSTYTAGFGLRSGNPSNVIQGLLTISLFGSSNTWIAAGTFGSIATTFSLIMNGTKSLSDTLTQVRITTVNGTDTFDAGSINIMYEG